MNALVAHICHDTVVSDGRCEVCGCRNAGQYVEVVPRELQAPAPVLPANPAGLTAGRPAHHILPEGAREVVLDRARWGGRHDPTELVAHREGNLLSVRWRNARTSTDRGGLSLNRKQARLVLGVLSDYLGIDAALDETHSPTEEDRT